MYKYTYRNTQTHTYNSTLKIIKALRINKKKIPSNLLVQTKSESTNLFFKFTRRRKHKDTEAQRHTHVSQPIHYVCYLLHRHILPPSFPMSLYVVLHTSLLSSPLLSSPLPLPSLILPYQTK